MDYFQLSLSSTDNTFSAGQIVEGTVRVSLSQPTAVNAIIVCLTGRANTSFEKREGERWLTSFRTYIASDGRLIVTYGFSHV